MAAVVAAVVTAVTTAVTAIVTAVTAVVAAVTPFVGIAIGFVAGAFIGSIGVRPPNIADVGGGVGVPGTSPDPSQEAIGVTITKQGSNKPIPIVYGFRRIGGTVIFAETNGETNKYLYGVYTLCEGEIEGIKRLIVDDIEVPLPSEADGIYTHGQIYTVNTGRFADRMKFQLFYGTDDQGQSELANESASWGNAQRHAPGIAYAVFRFEWQKITTQEEADENPYKGGIPQIKFDVLGRKVRDCRDIPTGGSISSVSNTSYSFNPANVVADYITNQVFGCGLGDDELDGDSFRIAANKFEETVNYSSGVSGRSLTLNAVLEPTGSNMNMVKSLLQGARSALPFQQGKYRLIVEDGGNATSIQSSTVDIAFDVDKSHIIGGIELEGPKKDNFYNEVRVNYIDPDKEFTSQQVVYKVDSDRVADNNQPLIGEFSYNTVTNQHFAEDFARLIYEKSRKGRNVLFEATQELLNATVGDIIRITDTVTGLNNDTFRIVGMRLSPEGFVVVEANEHDATIYPYVTQAQYEIAPPLYKPDIITLEPLVREPPKYPIGIFPPNDPDNDWTPGDTDSAGIVIDPPPNVILPPIEDPDNFFQGNNTVRYFEYFTGQYDGETWIRFHSTINGSFDRDIGGIRTGTYGEGLLHNWREYGSIFTGGVYDIPSVTPTSTFVETTSEGVDIYEHTVGLDYGRIVTDAVTIGGTTFNGVALLPNRPRYNIQYAQLEYYQNGSLVYQTNWNINDIPNQAALQTYKPISERIYGAKEFIMPLIPNASIKFRWIKDWNTELVDGSYLARSYVYYGDTLLGFKEFNRTYDYGFGPASAGYYDGGHITRYATQPLAYAYKLPDGTTTQARSNIEALLNYYNDMATRSLPGSGGSSSTSFNQPLG